MKESVHETAMALELPAAPLTLEGSALLHQFFRLRRAEWNRLESRQRTAILEEAGSCFAARGDGQSAIFSQLGHKGDLIVVHFRSGFDELDAAQIEVARLGLSEFLEQSYSYVSVAEIGLYEASVRLYRELAERGMKAHSPEWNNAVAEAISEQQKKLSTRLRPPIPDRRYLCFYPMNKRRSGNDNWYMQPIAERQRMMHEHGLIGRRYAGQVTQIISGSIGFDDWEWGVDLFADDPLVFKRLVYEMRFDESSARFAEFGPFYFGIRLNSGELARIF
ncbi:MAG TPA: hydrogen peroxide-dependent heme synthase [Candidatus Binataceae bacterium]|nr:hydrogen peroxide-dependent heme synthase [Candidatus Binataceae bacterium]